MCDDAGKGPQRLAVGVRGLRDAWPAGEVELPSRPGRIVLMTMPAMRCVHAVKPPMLQRAVVST